MAVLSVLAALAVLLGAIHFGFRYVTRSWPFSRSGPLPPLPHLHWKSPVNTNPNIKSRNSGGKRRVAVTGGSGFLGKCLLDELLQTMPPSDLLVVDLFPPQGAHQAIPFFKFNISDSSEENIALMAKRLEGFDSVIHCAGIVSLAPRPELIHSVNVVGTAVMLNASYDARVSSFIGISSAAILCSKSRPTRKAKESDPVPSDPVSIYATSKVEAEKLILEANSAHFSTAVVRFPGLYGIEDRMIAEKIVKGEFPGAPRGGKQCWCYVKNAAYGLALLSRKLIDSPATASGHAYYMGDGEPHDIIEFWNGFLALEGKGRKLNLVPYALAYSVALLSEGLFHYFCGYYRWELLNFNRAALAHVVQEYYFNQSKAVQVLGYQPPFSSRDAFEEILAYYRSKKII